MYFGAVGISWAEKAARIPARNAVTLRMKNGEVQVTDGPFVETKEALGGILLLEAPRPEPRHL